MSDDKASETVSTVDPVAAARARLATQEGSPGEVSVLRKQVRALWILSVVTLLLVIVVAGFSFLPRLFGVRMLGGPSFQGQPGQFQRGTQQQQGGTGQTGTGQQTTP